MITTSTGSMRFLVIKPEFRRELRFFANPDISSSHVGPKATCRTPCRSLAAGTCSRSASALRALGQARAGVGGASRPGALRFLRYERSRRRGVDLYGLWAFRQFRDLPRLACA